MLFGGIHRTLGFLRVSKNIQEGRRRRALEWSKRVSGCALQCASSWTRNASRLKGASSRTFGATFDGSISPVLAASSEQPSSRASAPRRRPACTTHKYCCGWPVGRMVSRRRTGNHPVRGPRSCDPQRRRRQLNQTTTPSNAASPPTSPRRGRAGHPSWGRRSSASTTRPMWGLPLARPNRHDTTG